MARIIDNFIDRQIGKLMLEAANKRDSEHVSSGKLSASRLGDPLQWQVLYTLGVLKDPLDEYVVRKFERGHHIEAWVLQYYLCDTQQEKVEYRDVVGRVDAMVDTNGWDFPHGIIPVEIKSVSNAKYQRIVGTARFGGGGPDRGHVLQAVLYGLAKDSKWVAVSYVAADDYRVQTYMIEVKDYQQEVDDIINAFNKAMTMKLIPKFEPRELWQSNPKYNKYIDWSTKTPAQLKAESKKLFK